MSTPVTSTLSCILRVPVSWHAAQDRTHTPTSMTTQYLLQALVAGGLAALAMTVAPAAQAASETMMLAEVRRSSQHGGSLGAQITVVILQSPWITRPMRGSTTKCTHMSPWSTSG